MKAELPNSYQGGGSWLDESDRAERAADIIPLRACFYTLIGDSPILAPHDLAGAAMYLRQISIAIDRGGWSHSEWNRLYRLRNKWSRRADGLDARFNAVGNRQGGITKLERRDVSTHSAIIGIMEMIDGKDNTR